jgi:hypothetical protein
MPVTLELRIDDQTREGLDAFIGNNRRLSAAISALGDEMERVEQDSAEYVELQIRHAEALRRLSDGVRDSAGQMRLDNAAKKEADGLRLQEELVRRKGVLERKNLADMLNAADKTGGALDGLSEKVKYLNQLNITPRGYEMYAFRMTSMLESIGTKGALALGAVATAAAGVTIAVKRMVDSGDPAIERFNNSVERLGYSYEHFASSLGRSTIIVGAVNGVAESIENLSEIISEGAPTIRGAWSVMWGDLEGARAARREIDASRKAIEELGKAAGRARANEVIDRLHANRFTLEKPYAGVNGLSELNAKRNEEEDRFRKLMENARTEADKKAIEAQQTKVITDIDARRREVLLQQLELKKQISDLDEKAAGKNFDAKRIDTLSEVTDEYKRQRAELERLDKLHRLTAEDQAKRIRQLTELQQRKADLEREALEWVADQENRLLQGKIRGWEMEARADAQRMDRQKAFERQQEEFRMRQIAERSRMLGGDEAAKAAMDQLNPRAVRDAIVESRLNSRRDQLKDRFAGEREQFDQTWNGFEGNEKRFDPVTRKVMTRDEAFNQMLRRQAKFRDADLKRTRFDAFSDFNRGNVRGDEMRQGQSDALGKIIGTLEDQGKASSETAEAMRNSVQAINQLGQNVETVARDMQNLKNELLQARLAAEAQGQRVQRNAAQRQGGGRF